MAWSDRAVALGVGGQDVTSRLLGSVEVTQWASAGSAEPSPGSCSMRLDNSDGLLNSLTPGESPVDVVYLAGLTASSASTMSRSFEGGLPAGSVSYPTSVVYPTDDSVSGQIGYIDWIVVGTDDLPTQISTYVETGTAGGNVGFYDTPATPVTGDQWWLGVVNDTTNYADWTLIEYTPGAASTTTAGGATLPANWVEILYPHTEETSGDYHDEIRLSIVTGIAKRGDRSLKVEFLTDRSTSTTENDKWTYIEFRFPLTTAEQAEFATDQLFRSYCYVFPQRRDDAASVDVDYQMSAATDTYSGAGKDTVGVKATDAFKYTGSYAGQDPWTTADADQYYPYGTSRKNRAYIEGGYLHVRLRFRNWSPNDYLYVDGFVFDPYDPSGTRPATVDDETYTDPAYDAGDADRVAVYTGTVKEVQHDWSIADYQTVTVRSSDLMAAWGTSYPYLLDRAHIDTTASEDWSGTPADWLDGYYPLSGSTAAEVVQSVAGTPDYGRDLRLRTYGGSADSTLLSFEAQGVDGRGALRLLPSSSTLGWRLYTPSTRMAAVSVFFKTPSSDGTLMSIETGDYHARIHLVNGLATLEVVDGSTTSATGPQVGDDTWHHAFLHYTGTAWQMVIDGTVAGSVTTAVFSDGTFRVGGAGYITTDDFDLLPDLTLSCLSTWHDMDPDWATLFVQRVVAVGLPGHTVTPGAALDIVNALSPSPTTVTYADAGRTDVVLSGATGGFTDIVNTIARTEQGRAFVDGEGGLVFDSHRAGQARTDANTAEVGLSELAVPPTIEWSELLQAEVGTVVQVSWSGGGPITVDVGAGFKQVVTMDTLCKDSVDAWQAAANSITSAWPARATIRQIGIDLLGRLDAVDLLGLTPGSLLSLTGFPANTPTVDTLYTVEGRQLSIHAGQILLTLNLHAFRETDEFVLGTDDLSGDYGLRL